MTRRAGEIVRMKVNSVDVSVPAGTADVLVDTIRDELGLIGTNVGCRTGDCGACTVIRNGRSVKSCLVLTRSCEGDTVETVESLASSHVGRRILEAFKREFAFQCGFCTPGMLLCTKELLGNSECVPPGSAIAAISGNLCRCTGYQPIIEAVLAAVRDGKDIES